MPTPTAFAIKGVVIVLTGLLRCASAKQNWTPNAMYVATRLFASNLNAKLAQRSAAPGKAAEGRGGGSHTRFAWS